MDISPRKNLWSRDFVLICLIGLLVSIGMQVLNATMTLYAVSLGATATFSGMMATFFAFFAAIFRMISGRFSDVRGRRLTMLLGAVTFSVSVLAFGTFALLPALIIFRSIQAVGFSGISTAAAAAAADVTPREQLGEGLGFFSLGQSLAMAIGPALGLAFAGRGNFRMLYLITAVMIALCLIFAMSLTYEKQQLRKWTQQPDAKASANNADIIDPIEAQPAGIWKFIDPKALPASLIYLLICLAVGGMITFLPLYAREKGFNLISLFFLLQAAAMFITRLVTGRLFDRKGPIPVIVPALTIATGTFILILLAESQELFLLAGFMYGSALGMLQPIFNALAVRSAPVHRRGAASATFNLSIDVGIGIGSAIWGVIIDRAGFSLMFTGSALCTMLAMLASLAVFSRRKNGLRAENL